MMILKNLLVPLHDRAERSPEEEAADEGEASTGGQHFQRHGHLEQRDPSVLGHHVRLLNHLCIFFSIASSLISISPTFLGKERGASGSCGGRAFRRASEEECGASPSETSSTLLQVDTTQELQRRSRKHTGV